MMPEPLTSIHCDQRDFPWMPLDVIRLRDSDLTALLSAEAFRAAVLLWCASWHQVPAASLPNNDQVLAKLAGYGRDVASWVKVRDDALHGFIECSDGRFYHPVVAEKAREADEQREKQKQRTQKATEARRAKSDARTDGDRDDHRNGGSQRDRYVGRNEVQHTRPEQTRPDKEKNKNPKTSTETLERVAPASSAEPPPSAPGTLSPKPKAAPARKGLAALGSPLPDEWVPDDRLCAKVAADFGMTDADLQSELPAFHALNVSGGVLSQDWSSTFYLFCKRWKEHHNKQAAPRVQLSRPDPAAASTASPETYTEAIWDGVVKLYAQSGRWSRHAGNDPTLPGCLAPRHLLEKHGINPATGERSRGVVANA